MRYILYARKSSESEDRQVQSIDDQLKALRETSTRYGLKVVAEFTESKSAKAPNTRPLFAEMLSRIQKGEAEGILCWSINRLARNPIDSGQISWLLQTGVLRSIRTVDREYLPEDNVLLMAVESGAATQYIIDLRKAVLRGMTSKAERGWLPGNPPQGYRTNRDTREIEPREPQFTLLRQAWDLALTGAYTVPQIREALWNWGFACSRNRTNERRHFSDSHMYRIFDNPFYYGAFRFNGRLYQGKHRPMVSKAEFDRVQSLIHRDFHVQPQKHEFAFTGLIRCGTCGCHISADRKIKYFQGTGRTVAYEYYRCTRRRGHCREGSVTGAFLEGEIDRALGRLTIDPRFGEWLRDVLARFFAQEIAGEDGMLGQQSLSLEAIEKKLNGLLELRLAREITAAEFERHKAHYQDELVKLRFRSNQQAEHQRAVERALAFGMRARKAFRSGDMRRKRQVADVFASRYTLSGGRLEITLHPLLEKLLTFEPGLESERQVQNCFSTSTIPNRWALWENIRNLMKEVSELSPNEIAVFATLVGFDEDEEVDEAIA